MSITFIPIITTASIASRIINAIGEFVTGIKSCNTFINVDTIMTNFSLKSVANNFCWHEWQMVTHRSWTLQDIDKCNRLHDRGIKRWCCNHVHYLHIYQYFDCGWFKKFLSKFIKKSVFREIFNRHLKGILLTIQNTRWNHKRVRTSNAPPKMNARTDSLFDLKL